jgi:hypothetical protein
MAETQQATRPLVVIPCGGRKQAPPWCGPAWNLYTGPYFRACRITGLQLAGGRTDRVLILSGRYGLLAWGDEVEPYEMRITAAGAVIPEHCRSQASRRGLIGEREVVGLCGADYADIVRYVWPHATFPLAGVGGIGRQLRRMREMRQG